MRGRLYIPDEVKQNIRAHLQHAMTHAKAGFAAAHEDEDTVTGDLGACLRSGIRTVRVLRGQEVPGDWRWSVTYYKFRGRGRGAAEARLGADGVFELELTVGRTRRRKSLLFQAKMDGQGGRDLFSQAVKLTTWREAAFVLIYSDKGYEAASIDEVIQRRGQLRSSTRTALVNFLGTDFLDCHVGDDEVRYDGRRKRLAWRTLNDETVEVQFEAKHRIRVRVEPPMSDDEPRVDRTISPEHIHEHRMKATDQELLSLADSQATPTAIRKARKQRALAYHLDRVNELDELGKAILNRRMQEVNAAADRIGGTPRHRGAASD